MSLRIKCLWKCTTCSKHKPEKIFKTILLTMWHFDHETVWQSFYGIVIKGQIFHFREIWFQLSTITKQVLGEDEKSVIVIGHCLCLPRIINVMHGDIRIMCTLRMKRVKSSVTTRDCLNSLTCPKPGIQRKP